MKIIKNMEVPTGNILIIEGEKGKLECLSIGDYGKDVNIKADFLGLTKHINGVDHARMMPLENKWVITISSQYGCSMGCKFCDVPKVGPGVNATYHDMLDQIIAGLSLHPEVEETERLNIHFARMGEPTFNGNVLDVAACLRRNIKKFWDRSGTVHPVVSTMFPRANRKLVDFLDIWCSDIKNKLYEGEAGLQFSINSTSNKERFRMFNGSSLQLEEISRIGKLLPRPVGRKYTLNFAIDDNSVISGKVLRKLFDPEFFICKITPIHACYSAVDNGFVTSDGYEQYYPYSGIENDLRDNGFDVLVFVPSKEEDESRITCGNAILSGE